MMSLGQRYGIQVETRQSYRLTHAQTQEFGQHLLQMRLNLIEALYGEQYTPKASCPKCSHPLSGYEILKGFNSDPNDFLTTCPECWHRFPARIHQRTAGGYAEIAFYCPAQTLAQLPDLVDVPLDAFRTLHAEVYHSAVVHFGGLKQAFAKIGCAYAHTTDLDWQNVVRPYLGKLPDTVIAELASAPLSMVRKLRKNAGIRPFSKREIETS